MAGQKTFAQRRRWDIKLLLFSSDLLCFCFFFFPDQLSQVKRSIAE